MLDSVMLTPRSPFHGFLASIGTSPAGVIVEERAHLQIATVIARSGAFRGAVAARYGIDLEAAPRSFAGPAVTFLGTGPRTWLAVRENGLSLAEELARELGDCAAVSDQSDGYAVLRVSGASVRETFEKGFAIDLHPRAFKTGNIAVTTCAHIGVIIRQVDETPAYDVALFRSYAGSFCHWLSESAAEFGLHVLQGGRG